MERLRPIGVHLFMGFLLLCLLVPSRNALGQDQRRLQFSMAANPAINWLKSDYTRVKTDGTRLGIGFGLQCDYYFMENYALSTGFLINNSGGVLQYLDDSVRFLVDGDPVFFNTDPSLDGVSITYKLQYIEIPLLLKMRTNDAGGKAFYGLFGLNTRMNIQAKGKADQLSINDAGFLDEVKFLNLGYQIGGGMEFALGKNLALLTGLSYYNGFSDVTANTGGRKSDKTVQRSVNIHLAVMF